MGLNKIVVLSGLTASGKTALSLDLARQFNAEIVSADSRQVYRGLDIGTAKVTPDERAGIPHHLLDIVDPHGNPHFSVGDWLHAAYQAVDEIIARGHLPLIVGGTGLYSRALIAGYGFGGRPNQPRYQVLQICLTPPNDWLVPRIRQRNQERLAAGMLAETEQLLASGVSRDFLYSLGLEYRLNLRHLTGELDRAAYEQALETETRQFIKRQRTWYRKEDPTLTHYLTDPTTYHATATHLITAFLAR